MSDNHIVKSYEEELTALRDLVRRMGLQAETQLRAALQALAERDDQAAHRVVAEDRAVDTHEEQTNDLTLRLLALRAPVADDLRRVVTALKVSSELERIADLAANIAKRTLVLNQSPPAQPVRTTSRMGALVAGRVRQVLDAYIDLDAEAALGVWSTDEEVDDLHSSLFREILTYMMEDPRTITPCTHLMFVAKNLERCGDHATNIAEMVHFLVRGTPLREVRPKRTEMP